MKGNLLNPRSTGLGFPWTYMIGLAGPMDVVNLSLSLSIHLYIVHDKLVVNVSVIHDSLIMLEQTTQRILCWQREIMSKEAIDLIKSNW